MKKNILLPLLMIFCQQLFSQNVGIGTNVPNSSAMLEIKSSSKGVLFPNIFLQNSVDGTTVQSPAPGLIIFNTNPAIIGGTGLFYNANTSASPSWAKVGDIKFPYSGATSSALPSFYIMNYGAASSSAAIKGYSENGSGIDGESNNGVGVYAKSNNGISLEVNGKLKIAGAGQMPAQGKVLTTDANGNATWEGAIAFSSTGIQPDGAAEFSDDVEKKVPFYTEDYDYGNSYNPSTGSPYSTFTAPVKGIYHFDVKVSWANSTSTYTGSFLYLKSTYAGVTKYRVQDFSEFGVHFMQQEISRDIMLEAGEMVFASIKQSSGGTQNLFVYNPNSPQGNQCYFNGRLLMRLQ